MRCAASASSPRNRIRGSSEAQQGPAMAQQEVLIPDIGDAEDVEVIEILAKGGAHIGKGDPLIVIESDKASMEVPASVSGTLRKITVALGDKVRTGQAIAV